MSRMVYIKNLIYMDEGFNCVSLADKGIDLIGKICITVIRKLFSGITDVEKDIPIFFGSAYSSLHSLHEFNAISETQGPLAVNPSLFPNTVLNSPSCRASIYHNITQPVYNISNGALSGLNALELAYLNIVSGEIDNAIVCAAEEYSEFEKNVEEREYKSCGGAIYLSAQRNKNLIIGITKVMKPDSIEKIGVISESADVIKAIGYYMKNNQGQTDVLFGYNDKYNTMIRLRRN